MNLLNRMQVAARLGMRPKAFWLLRKRDPRFPQPVRPRGSHQRWIDAEVDAYIEVLRADRDGTPGAAA